MASKRRRTSKTQGTGKSGTTWSGAFGKFCLVAFILLAIPLGYFGTKIYQQLKDMPDIAVLERYEPIEAIQVFDKNDRLVCTVEGDEDRRVVPLNQVSPQMQQAILAAEDHHFYEHHGINPVSIVRAFFANLQAGKVVEGGSTITQQLIKNLFFEDKGRTVDRKLKEAVMSYEIERRYTKDRILEMYLNQVYFGNGGYGIERASQRYFGTSAAGLDLAQSAFLAGLVKAPSELGSPANRKPAISRQHEILDRMVEFGYITKQQAERARKETLKFRHNINPLQRYPFYISYVLEQLKGRFSEAEMRRQGLRVYTNLDPQVQDLAEKTLNADLKKAPKGVSQSALVCLSVKDGAVLALVGGVGDFWKYQFNRATNPHTAGSSFKPFVYLTAFLRNTFTPESIIEDSPITIKQGWGLPDWQPKDFDHKFMGKITVRKALTLSRNVPAVRIGKATGIDNVIETARLAGISTKLDANLSLSLGSSAVTPLDMAGAYSTFARGGIAIKPQVLRRIENNRGQIIEQFEAHSDKVFDADAVARLVDIMQDVVKVGTGTAAKLPDRPVAGKTGTADAAKDIWFIGFTPDTVCALWGGNDENLPIPGHYVTGGVVMAKIWKDFMSAYYAMRPTPPGAFMAPSKHVELGVPVETETNDAQMPTLVPLNPEEEKVDEMLPLTPPVSPQSGAPAPVTPSTGAGNDSPPPLAPTSAPRDIAVPRNAPTLYSNPSTYSAPAPYTTPTRDIAVPRSAPATAPIPAAPNVVPLGSAPNSVPPQAPSSAYGQQTGGGRYSTVYTSSGSKRTIINEDPPTRYSSISDPNLTPGLGQRRFADSRR